VFVTGHSGFKGLWLTLWLVKKGAIVKGFSLDDRHGNLKYLDDLVYTEIGDITDFPIFSESVKQFEPEIIFHLAAQSLVLDSYEDPFDTFKVNFNGTLNLLEISKNISSLKSLLIVTSDKCYRNNDDKKIFSEDAQLGGLDPYSNSKACAELVSYSYYQSFFRKKDIGVATVRAGNVIGGGDWSKNRLIPDIFRSINNGKNLSIRNPKSTRPWQFVLEPLHGYIMLAQKLATYPLDYSSPWNFGPSNLHSVTVEEIMEKINQSSKNFFNYDLNPTTFHEASYLMISSNKALSELNWKTLLSIDETISLTVDWYDSYLNNSNMIELFNNQINYYEKRISQV